MGTLGERVEEEVVVALRRIARAASLHSRHIQQTYGLTSPQLFVLRELARREGATGAELARAASLSPATVTGILDRLERRGLIDRVRSEEDRRRVLTRVTQAGRALLAAAPPPLQTRFLAGFRTLPDWEQSFLLGALQRLASLMGGAGEPDDDGEEAEPAEAASGVGGEDLERAAPDPRRAA
ncbi:MAG: MarR family winged helix-turn-helix transcriptional regulator [Deferrisomatales bacterium]